MYCFISQGMRRTKSKTITEPVLLKYSSNICLDYKISVLFKYILLITHPSTERFRDEFSAKNWTTTKPINLAFSTPASTALLCTRITQTWARVTQAILPSTAQFYMSCFSSIACNVFIAHQLLGHRGDVSLNVKLPGTHTLQKLIQNTEQFPVVWG